LRRFILGVLILLSPLILSSKVVSEPIDYSDIVYLNNVEVVPEDKPIPRKVYNYAEMSVPMNKNSFAYMNHSAITSKDSRQWQVKQIAYTDIYGLRCVEQYYLVAMGTYYGKVGDKFKIHTASGGWYVVMLGDIKSDAHTDSTHRVCQTNGSIIEFIMDGSVITNSTKFNFATKHLRDRIVKIEKEIN
jgi:hypothetical protein